MGGWVGGWEEALFSYLVEGGRGREFLHQGNPVLSLRIGRDEDVAELGVEHGEGAVWVGGWVGRLSHLLYEHSSLLFLGGWVGGWEALTVRNSLLARAGQWPSWDRGPRPEQVGGWWVGGWKTYRP